MRRFPVGALAALILLALAAPAEAGGGLLRRLFRGRQQPPVQQNVFVGAAPVAALPAASYAVPAAAVVRQKTVVRQQVYAQPQAVLAPDVDYGCATAAQSVYAQPQAVLAQPSYAMPVASQRVRVRQRSFLGGY